MGVLLSSDVVDADVIHIGCQTEGAADLILHDEAELLGAAEHGCKKRGVGGLDQFFEPL
jgi:hypothetical protein